jgi:hypothetical protein
VTVIIPASLPPEDQLEYWRAELARALKANPGLPWVNLIEWAEEAEELSMKTATRSGRAKLVTLEQRLTAMERLAGAWQREAERAREDLAVPADTADVAEFRIWCALDRPLTEDEVHEHIKILRFVRLLAVDGIEIAHGTYVNAKKRVMALHTPIAHMGKTWCAECSVRRQTGPRTEEWVAFVPHPCPTLEALDWKESTPVSPECQALEDGDTK